MPPIRTLLEDLITLRSNKIRQSIMNVDATGGAIRLLNFSAVEIQRIKSLISNAFNEFYLLKSVVNQSTLRA